MAEALKQRPEAGQPASGHPSLPRAAHLGQGRLFWPSLDAGADYELANADFPLDKGWSAGVYLTWPLFSGFFTKGQVSEYQAQVRQRQALLKELELSISQEVEQAWLVLKESAERIEVAETARINAEENFRLAQGRYEAGVGDAIEFTDAQVSLFDAPQRGGQGPLRLSAGLRRPGAGHRPSPGQQPGGFALISGSAGQRQAALPVALQPRCDFRHTSGCRLPVALPAAAWL